MQAIEGPNAHGVAKGGGIHSARTGAFRRLKETQHPASAYRNKASYSWLH